MGFGAFLRSYIVPTIMMVAAALIMAVGILGDAATLRGLSPKSLELAALALFVVGVFTLFYQMNNRMLAGGKASFSGDATEAPPGRVIRLDGRRYVPASFAEAYLAFEKTRHTGVQYQAFLAPYVGQWMKLSGNLSFIVGETSNEMHVVVKHDEDSNSFTVRFDKKWAHHFARIKPGDRIEFDTQIRKAFLEGIVLGRGELH
jgi:hypothetical protein